MDIRKLIIDRRRESGIGLYGSCEAIARWLFNDYNVIVSTSWVAQVIKDLR